MRRAAFFLLLTLIVPALAGVACEIVCTQPHHQGVPQAAEDCHQRDRSRPIVASSASLSCHTDTDQAAVVRAAVTTSSVIHLIAPTKAATVARVILTAGRSLTGTPARPSSSSLRPTIPLRI